MLGLYAGMDKEDAMVVFEEHIRELEKEEEEDKEREKKRLKRQQRKNRDSFVMLLDELHEQGKLTSMSLWVELYPIISADLRFSAMLGQPGSTPLDLFKFYVEDLKSRFHDEKKIIKEILREKGFDVQRETHLTLSPRGKEKHTSHCYHEAKRNTLHTAITGQTETRFTLSPDRQKHASHCYHQTDRNTLHTYHEAKRNTVHTVTMRQRETHFTLLSLDRQKHASHYHGTDRNTLHTAITRQTETHFTLLSPDRQKHTSHCYHWADRNTLQTATTKQTETRFTLSATDVNTSFEEFATVVCEDRRSATLDAGNVKLTYNAFLEKAEARERERLKEEARRLKRLEAGFKSLLKSYDIDYNSNWDDTRTKIEGESAFEAITLESERVRIFKEYQHENEEACSHRHSRSKKSKKNKKNKKRSRTRSRSRSYSESEDDRGHSSRKKRRHRSRTPSATGSDSSDSHYSSVKRSSRHKKSKKKKKSRSAILCPYSEDISTTGRCAHRRLRQLFSRQASCSASAQPVLWLCSASSLHTGLSVNDL
uniref:FF domain-containing protein n=1 Tax=Timema cristinae TaxID=61476 RepID=A0A7R9CX77_TIMCR|nr:unnamed protein product [Timema cristinae]